MVLQLLILGGGGLVAFTRLEAKVAATPAGVDELQRKVAVLESQQIDAGRVTSLEANMRNLENAVTRLQNTLDRQERRN